MKDINRRIEARHMLEEVIDYYGNILLRIESVVDGSDVVAHIFNGSHTELPFYTSFSAN